MTYLITLTCYGCHLHGSESGSVDREHHAFRTPILEVNAARAAAARERMNEDPYILDHVRRNAVLTAIQGVCTHRGWCLMAAHVRTTHVHTVVQAEAPPERIMDDFKSYATRRLSQMGLDSPARKRWTDHGSTQWLWTPRHISAAIQYVVAEQGEAMAVFQSEDV